MKALLIIAMLLAPTSVFAEGLSRAEAYKTLWDSIQRPAYETIYVTPYADVAEGHPYYVEITYGKRRKILADEKYFLPNDPVTQATALLWLFRTRNVAEIDKMQSEHVADLVGKYPITDYEPSKTIASRADLLSLMQALDSLLAQEVHTVSFYADDFHGKGTAFGETFDMNEITAAHRSFPHDTLVEVTNIENGKSVTVRINDRGPYIDGRNMDLSKAAFEAISPLSRGVLKAKFRRLGHKDLVDKCSDQPTRYHRRITRDVRFHRGLPHTLSLGETLWLGSNTHFVVRGITYPNGDFERFQDFIFPEERFKFEPSVTGKYSFIVGTKDGRKRSMTMSVQECS